MAFKASNVLPADAYLTIKRGAVQLKVNLQGFVTYMAANDIDYDYLRGVYRTLERAKDQFDTLKTTAGLAQYAKDQESDQAYDVVTEFNSLITTIQAAITWLDNNVSTNVTAKLPENWRDGTLISNTFTPVQTAGLRTALNAVSAEII